MRKISLRLIPLKSEKIPPRHCEEQQRLGSPDFWIASPSLAITIKYKSLIAGSILIGLLGCSARQINSSSELVSPVPTTQSIIESRTVVGEKDDFDVGQLQKLNQKAGKPTFGLIMGFYQLPGTMPAGHVAISEGYVFGEPYRSFWFQATDAKPYAVLPAAPKQAEVLATSLNKMLDAGIRFKEVSMADAVMVMNVEKKMMLQNKTWFFPRSIAPGVDLLVSIQTGFGEIGPIYVGRVIATIDGRLLALVTWPDVGAYTLQPLVDRLVSDALRRLANEK